ncbi:MAG: carboxylating nicotinate-nucleotide diphosphorylase [Candidatus Nanopelagicales bacterium]|nr:carboxylating nicotinate-nucleotide diphosphorylase [Candidatus Nanopelagicales bacterium]MCF8537777.1 carboxylating nicotinate-nucleotide diphosphorylase [Candidatus Nanopelagicales bacterium]MCF8541710.1 carboxylating nicotinate-nucleotide diphosphorylase [Candidatus Nanopelagicales bacterium]MCF8557738.1 carboxylating nicotinate-nucleotide diphosphorylase [Candidatus Nanopelagicales bacterium]
MSGTTWPKEISDPLVAAGFSLDAVSSLITMALDEDLDGGVDVTTVATVPVDQRATLDLVARGAGVSAGAPVAAAVFAEVCGSDAAITIVTPDGTRVEPGTVILSVTGSTHELLRAERPALNLLGHLSGIATATRAWVDAIEGTGASIRDTRKTTPGMRRLEKYAVRCGGGVNHRMSLSDAALVKDNHVVAAGGVAEAFDLVRTQFPGLDVEVEVDSLDQLDEVLGAGADLVLLDNFTPEQMREAVRRTSGRARLEASGGLSLDVAAEVASTGVDYLAVGALTHSAPVLDIGADLRQES